MEAEIQLPNVINIVFIGDQATGKSSIIMRCFRDTYADDYSVVYFNNLGHNWY